MVIRRKEIQKLVDSYELDKIAIGVLGSHSAEEVGVSAKSSGLPTVIICQKGREALYTRFNKHLYDHIFVLDRFSDIVNNEVQDKLRELIDFCKKGPEAAEVSKVDVKFEKAINEFEGFEVSY